MKRKSNLIGKRTINRLYIYIYITEMQSAIGTISVSRSIFLKKDSQIATSSKAEDIWNDTHS